MRRCSAQAALSCGWTRALCRRGDICRGSTVPLASRSGRRTVVDSLRPRGSPVPPKRSATARNDESHFHASSAPRPPRRPAPCHTSTVASPSEGAIPAAGSASGPRVAGRPPRRPSPRKRPARRPRTRRRWGSLKKDRQRPGFASWARPQRCWRRTPATGTARDSTLHSHRVAPSPRGSPDCRPPPENPSQHPVCAWSPPASRLPPPVEPRPRAPGIATSHEPLSPLCPRTGTPPPRRLAWPARGARRPSRGRCPRGWSPVGRRPWDVGTGEQVSRPLTRESDGEPTRSSPVCYGAPATSQRCLDRTTGDSVKWRKLTRQVALEPDVKRALPIRPWDTT